MFRGMHRLGISSRTLPEHVCFNLILTGGCRGTRPSRSNAVVKMGAAPPIVAYVGDASLCPSYDGCDARQSYGTGTQHGPTRVILLGAHAARKQLIT